MKWLLVTATVDIWTFPKQEMIIKDETMEVHMQQVLGLISLKPDDCNMNEWLKKCKSGSLRKFLVILSAVLQGIREVHECIMSKLVVQY